MGRTDKVIIFDTTLRDGEQSPGASLNSAQKLEVAKQLKRLGVDVIEAGFPIVSQDDFESVRQIAGTIKGPVICGLARSLPADIKRAFEAVRPSPRPRIHVFLATSRIHMKYKLRKAEDEILKMACASVKLARRFVRDVEFSPEDASRTEPAFLFKVLAETIDSGATTVNIPDTVGYANPVEYGNLIAGIIRNVPNIGRAVVSVHCHNDLGLAVANSLSAVASGARQVECTVNGLGERAGSAALEEVVMALRTRKDFYRVTTGIRTNELCNASRLVSHLTGMAVQSNKAIVGANAFRHESGIHQDGILKKSTTYEIMKPRDVGFEESKLVLGKHSGRHAFNLRLKKIGFRLRKEDAERAFVSFKALADKKKEIFDEDLVAVIEGQIDKPPEYWKLEYMHTTSGSRTIPTATVTLSAKGKRHQDAACGDGPVDACYKTIDRITGVSGELLEYSLRAVTKGKDAQGEVTLKVRLKDISVTGRGVSTDVIEASARAYLNAVNKAIARGSHPKT